MICWKHLTPMDKTMSNTTIGGKPVPYSGACGCKDGSNNNAARADRFMELVQSVMPEAMHDAFNTPHPQDGDPPMVEFVIDSALAMMSEIERRVEAGTLFGKGD